jgi:hypothetical protein
LEKIEKALANCGSTLRDKCHYLIFEKGWFHISKLEWNEALIHFSGVIRVSLPFINFDSAYFKELISENKKKTKLIGFINGESPKNQDLDTSTIDSTIKASKAHFIKNEKEFIVLPHKICVVILISCCYMSQQDLHAAVSWLLMAQYVQKKISDSNS